jgi:tetratricopeptide (TPR) repeat protein
MCVAYLFVGRPDDAIAGCRTVLRLSPGFLAAHYLIGVALLAKGEPQAALAEMRQETGTSSWRLIGLPIVWHALGKQAESDAALAELIRKHDKTTAYNIAYVYAYRGEADRAFEWLERAVDNQDGGLSEIVVQPLFANIRNDPRWLPFLRKLGKAPEQLAAIKFDVKLPGVPVAASAHAPADAKP